MSLFEYMDMMLLSASILSLEEITGPYYWAVIDNGSDPWSEGSAAVLSEATRGTPLVHISRPNCSYFLK